MTPRNHRKVAPTRRTARASGVALIALLTLSGGCLADLPADGREQADDGQAATTSASVATEAAERGREQQQEREQIAPAVAGGGTPAGSAVVPIAGAPESFAELVSQVRDAVVSVYTTTSAAQPGRGNMPWPGAYPPQAQQGLGSGFIADENGFILTNSHVIENAAAVRVETRDGATRSAEIVGVDPLTDLAVLKIEPFSGMTYLPLGDSEATRVGDWVVAVGNPFGLSFSVTAGILSARARRDVALGGDIRYVDFLQTDASINPGNSGGPLLNMEGQVIGINTAINQAGQGIGFAIPSTMIRPIFEQLRANGAVERSWMGVRIANVNDKIVERLGLDAQQGAYVSHIAQGGPADVAGIRAGDVILSFNGRDVEDEQALAWHVSNAGVGARVPVTVARVSGTETLELKLGELPGN